MAMREKMGLSIAPLFLRVGLGVTFLWAGLGKLLSEDLMVQGQDAAILANLGVNLGPGTPPQPKTIEAPEAPKEPVVAPETKPDPKPAAPDPGSRAGKASDKGAAPGESKKSGKLPALMELAGDGPGAGTGGQPVFSMSDFPEPKKVSRIHGITLLLCKSAAPPPDATGKAKMAIVPAWAGTGVWPIRLAWAAAVTETLGGTLVLVGLFTRLSALSLAWTIGVGMWLTVIGPAVQSGDTVLGFLPSRGRFDVQAWQTPLWQLMLLMSGIALFFAGPGCASLDSLVFSREPAEEPRAKPAE